MHVETPLNIYVISLSKILKEQRCVFKIGEGYQDDKNLFYLKGRFVEMKNIGFSLL